MESISFTSWKSKWSIYVSWVGLGSIFARGRGIYYICQRKINDYSVNMDVVLNNLKERTQTLHFTGFAILGYTVFKSHNEDTVFCGTLLFLHETNAFIKCSTISVPPVLHWRSVFLWSRGSSQRITVTELKWRVASLRSLLAAWEWSGTFDIVYL